MFVAEEIVRQRDARFPPITCQQASPSSQRVLATQMNANNPDASKTSAGFPSAFICAVPERPTSNPQFSIDTKRRIQLNQTQSNPIKPLFSHSRHRCLLTPGRRHSLERGQCSLVDIEGPTIQGARASRHRWGYGNPWRQVLAAHADGGTPSLLGSRAVQRKKLKLCP